MDARVVAVLRLLAETVARRHAEVTELRPEEGVLAVRHGETVARLHFEEVELLEFIDGAGGEGEDVWGEPLSDEVAAARFLSIHLDESLATQEPHESGVVNPSPGASTPSHPGRRTRAALASRRRAGRSRPADSTP